MKAKEYYKSTRMVETRSWTLEMALNFAEEYAEALRQLPAKEDSVYEKRNSLVEDKRSYGKYRR